MEWHGMAWHGGARLGKARHGKAWHGKAWQGFNKSPLVSIPAWHGTARQGLAWQGGAGHGTARHGKAWQGFNKSPLVSIPARQSLAGHGVAWRGWAWQGWAWHSTEIHYSRKKTRMNIEISIAGTTPLINNKFTDEAAMSASNGSRSSALGADRGTPQEIAESKLYIGLDGKPMIPQPNLLRCLVEGGRFHKVGKAQLTTAKSSQLYSCVDIQKAEIAIIHKQPWKVDTRAVRIPSTGGRILAHRPMFDDWQLDFEVELDETILNPKLFRAVVDDAGKRIGLGDFRPACKGPYGRFVVISWIET